MSPFLRKLILISRVHLFHLPLRKTVKKREGRKKTLTKKLTHQEQPFYRIHASGHAMLYHIWKMTDEFNPELMFPVHTKHSEIFQKFLYKNGQKVFISFHNNPLQIK